MLILQCFVMILYFINCCYGEKEQRCFPLAKKELGAKVSWYYDNLRMRIPIQCPTGLIRLNWITFSIPRNEFCPSGSIITDRGIISCTTCSSTIECTDSSKEELEAARKRCDGRRICDLTIDARDMGCHCQDTIKYLCYIADKNEYKCWSRKVEVSFNCIENEVTSPLPNREGMQQENMEDTDDKVTSKALTIGLPVTAAVIAVCVIVAAAVIIYMQRRKKKGDLVVPENFIVPSVPQARDVGYPPRIKKRRVGKDNSKSTKRDSDASSEYTDINSEDVSLASYTFIENEGKGANGKAIDDDNAEPYNVLSYKEMKEMKTGEVDALQYPLALQPQMPKAVEVIPQATAAKSSAGSEPLGEGLKDAKAQPLEQDGYLCPLKGTMTDTTNKPDVSEEDVKPESVEEDSYVYPETDTNTNKSSRYVNSMADDGVQMRKSSLPSVGRRVSYQNTTRGSTYSNETGDGLGKVLDTEQRDDTREAAIAETKEPEQDTYLHLIG